MKIQVSLASASDDIMQKWEEFGVEDCWVGERKDALMVRSIKVDKKKRGQGIGTKCMEYICDYADKHNLIVTLSPSTDFGATSKSRLVTFYRRFGFKPNKGRFADYRYSDSMIRTPTKKSESTNVHSFLENEWHNLGITDFWIIEGQQDVHVERMIVPPKLRLRGIGTKAIQLLCDYADEAKKEVTLSPTNEWGSDLKRLIAFYKRFGFVERPGNAFVSTMVRFPK